MTGSQEQLQKEYTVHIHPYLDLHWVLQHLVYTTNVNCFVALAFKMESNIAVSFNFKLKLQEYQQIYFLKVSQETKKCSGQKVLDKYYV